MLMWNDLLGKTGKLAFSERCFFREHSRDPDSFSGGRSGSHSSVYGKRLNHFAVRSCWNGNVSLKTFEMKVDVS